MESSDARAWLVTGGGGFLGSHLVDALLAAGHAVRILDDYSTGRWQDAGARCTILRGDVTDPALLRRAMDGMAGCFHLAAIPSVSHAPDGAPADTGGRSTTSAVFDAAAAAGRIPIVFASSASVYGHQPTHPVREDAPLAPLTPYARDKVRLERDAAAAFLDGGVPSFGLRLFNPYGPRQSASSPFGGVVARFTAAIRAGEELVVNGDGLQVRDFIFVTDAVAHLRAAMAAALRQPQAGIANGCTGRPATIIGLAEAIGRLVGRQARIRREPPRAGEVQFSLGDPAHAIATLGVRAATSLEDGLRATLGT
jgi:UDP-glucose 4-epimerase